MLSKQLSKEIVKDLYLEIPEFKIYIIAHLDEDSIYGYLVLDYLASFLKDIIVLDEHSITVKACYQYINKLCTLKNPEVDQWLKETFFESMIETGKPRNISRLMLKERALLLFEEVIAHPFFGD